MPFDDGTSQLLLLFKLERDLSSDDADDCTDGKLKIVLLLFVLLADKHFASSSDLIVGVVWM